MPRTMNCTESPQETVRVVTWCDPQEHEKTQDKNGAITAIEISGKSDYGSNTKDFSGDANEFSPGDTNDLTPTIINYPEDESYVRTINICHPVVMGQPELVASNIGTMSGTVPDVVPPLLPHSHYHQDQPASESIQNPNFNSPEVDRDRKLLGDKMISGLDQFFTCGSIPNESEIAKILADFNEILNSEDPYAFSISTENQDLIANTVEAFSELLIGGDCGGDDSDLLIVVDPDGVDQDSFDPNLPLGHEKEEEYYEEGYESDLPMVRKSMRRMRPVHMPPSPSSSSHGLPGSSGQSVSPYPRYIATTVTIPEGRRLDMSGTEELHTSSQLEVTVDNPLPNPIGRHTTSPVVREMENGSRSGHRMVTSPASSGSGEVTRSPPRESGTTEGCATFRPSTDLVFTNLHVLPPDLTEALADTTTDNGSTTATPTTTNTRRRASRGNNGPGATLLPTYGTTGRWPHRLSSVLALIGCTLGLTNICRFGSLSVEYGGNFTLQFTFLSIAFGIPLLLFHMSIGQYLTAGIVNMWKISPIFQGIGIGLVMSQAMVGVYTAVGVSWMFIYFRDSFIPRYDQYRWGKCFREYRACEQNLYNSSQLSETVPDYFNGVVLQRSSPEFPSSSYIPSGLKFTVAFNLAVVWMLVFVCLSKGLKSYGKVIHGFILIPITTMLVLSSKMIGLVPSEDAGLLFGQTSWDDFFFNTQTWIIAAREAFFTWGLFGACMMQITAHNRHSHSLKSDATIIVLVTTFVLLLTSFLGNACHYVLMSHGYKYVPSSFESELSFRFLAKKTSESTSSPPFPPYLTNQHTSFLMGVRVTKSELGELISGSSTDYDMVSGYQALRLATELFPTTMALLGSQGLSPFWTVIFYFTVILFGLAQQLAIWYTVIKGVIAIKPKVLKSWETTISFSICAAGFVLGLPLCTEFGIFVAYFLDYTIGSGWWIMVLYLLELVAVFIVRGAPYCGENIVTVLFRGGSKLSAIFAPILSFAWNVILPVAILILSISSFKTGNIRELYDWAGSGGYVFWPSWTRELGSLIQLLPLLTVPFVAIIQTCRYLSNGPPDLFDRIQLLYRPHSRGIGNGTGTTSGTTDFPPGTNSQTRPEDPPPKYTPPPSYSAVTGAKISKFLRNSLRRSIRRIAGTSSSNSTESLPPPPNYSSVIVEMNGGGMPGTSGGGHAGSSKGLGSTLLPILISPPEDSPGGGGDTGNLGPGRGRFEINIIQSSQSRASTLGRQGHHGGLSKGTAGDDGSSPAEGAYEKICLRRIASDITPIEVARILRASFRGEPSPAESSGSRHAQGPVPGGTRHPSSGNDPDMTYRNHNHDSSLSIINQETVSSMESYGNERLTSLPWNHNFDFTSRSNRNRRSNDSQLGLLANAQSPTVTSSRENVNCLGVNQLGIVNPSFPMTLEGGTTGSSAGHFRSSSLTVPTTVISPNPSHHSHSSSISGRHNYHRTN